jgi:thymidylate synthase
MEVVRARNVNDALVKGVQLLQAGGHKQDSRAGGTIEYPEPVCTVYERPLERVIFDPVRDANPFFHLMEALWMLAGRKDVNWLVRFNKRMATYSDDGKIFNAAYGYRWRKQFELAAAHGESFKDQLSTIVKMLRADPDSRRAILQIWDAEADLGVDSKDIACNAMAMFKVRDNRLNITVANRSNDIIWGCYGANAVQFSILLEYMAAQIGVKSGQYRQVSDSYHAYNDTWPKVSGIVERTREDPYTLGEVAVYPLVADPDSFDMELERWFEAPPDRLDFATWEDEVNGKTWKNPFFIEVATPVYNAWFCYKQKARDEAREWVGRCAASDWQRATTEWLERRWQR